MSDKQGIDILVLEVGGLIAICDYFVIASGSTDRHLKAMGEAVEEALRGLDVKPLRREGERDLRWLLLDYGDIVVHLFLDEARHYYELERLWTDAPVLAWDDADVTPADRRSGR